MLGLGQGSVPRKTRFPTHSDFLMATAVSVMRTFERMRTTARWNVNRMSDRTTSSKPVKNDWTGTTRFGIT
jgi:hypothetical protein